jgi:hypothetical protein
VNKGKRKSRGCYTPASSVRVAASVAKALAVLRVLRCAAIAPEFVREYSLSNESFGQLGEERPQHPFAHSLTAVGLQPALITFIDMHYIHIVGYAIGGYAIERIGGVLVGVATELLTLELDLRSLLLHG